MKKSIISIVILALLVVNIVLSGLVMFSVVPASKKTNELVTKICDAVDIELEKTGTSKDVAKTIPIDDIESYDIPGADAEAETMNLKMGADGKQHYAIGKFALSLNKEDKGYKNGKKNLEEKVSLVKALLIENVQKFTYEELQTAEGMEKLQETILKALQEMFDSTFIVKVGLTAKYQ